MKTIIFFCILFIFPSFIHAYQYPDASEKSKIYKIIRSIEKLSQKSKNLNEFGSKTLKQSKDILDIGHSSVYVLSTLLDNPDWKVRFWIVDIMGYLNNIDAERPLIKILNNKNERKIIRKRALKSLRMLNSDFAKFAEEGIDK